MIEAKDIFLQVENLEKAKKEKFKSKQRTVLLLAIEIKKQKVITMLFPDFAEKRKFIKMKQRLYNNAYFIQWAKDNGHEI